MPNLPPDEDRQFQHYTMKHRVVAWISMNLFDNFVYTVRHGLLKGKKRRGAWVGCRSRAPRRRNTASGTTSIFPVRPCTMLERSRGCSPYFLLPRRKLSFVSSRNAQNAKRLMENLALNGIANVQLRRTGVGSKSGTMKMVGPADAWRFKRRCPHHRKPVAVRRVP